MKIIFYLAFIFFTTTCIYGATFTSAIAEITPVGNNTVKGSVIFLQRGSDVEVTVALYNINTNPDGYHGIHVHVWGDLRGLLKNFGKIGANVTGALSVGTHFDPYNTKLHGCPDLTTGENQGSHGGDLGNWLAVGGTIEGVKTFSNFTLDGPINSIVGRAVVIHANEDDCADINSSGSRLGVGVIGIRWVDSTKDKNTARAGTGFDKAVCVLEGTSECTGSYCDITNTGFAYFSQVGKNSIRITAQVFGLTSERGWHIHTYGDLSSPNGDSTGGHWNPLNHKHGLPGQSELHLGDLGSIKTFSKNPDFGIYDNTIRHTATEWKIENLIGRAIIIHSDVDHGGDESVCSGSSVSGNSGKRVYQCVIGIVNPVSQKESITKLPTICTSEFKFDNTWESIPCASS